MLPKPCLIFNPAAGGMRATALQQTLFRFFSSSDVRVSTGPGSARELAAEAVQAGYQTIVAAGGDGTLNEVLNGIGDSPTGFEKVALAVLPAGTANVFAREFNIPRDVEKAWGLLNQGVELRIDLPQLEYTSKYGKERRYFAQLASAGADALAAEQVNWRLKKKIGYLAYVVSALKVLGQAHPMVSVSSQGNISQGEQIIVGNGRLYGGNFTFFPFADARDGQLEVVLFPKVTFVALADCIRGVFTGRLHQVGGSTYFKTSELSLTSSGRVPVQVDGEPVGELPATFRLEPLKLRIIVPPGKK